MQWPVHGKGRIERIFAYVENHFLPGRTFRDYADLNAQARRWCETVANATVKRVLGMSAEAAYVLEKPYLIPLPTVLPPVYEVVERTVDLSGYVSSMPIAIRYYADVGIIPTMPMSRLCRPPLEMWLTRR